MHQKLIKIWGVLGYFGCKLGVNWVYFWSNEEIDGGLTVENSEAIAKQLTQKLHKKVTMTSPRSPLNQGAGWPAGEQETRG